MRESISKENIRERVRDIVLNDLDEDPSQIRDDSLFVDDLGADWIDLTEMAVEFSDEFDLDIQEEDLNKLVSIEKTVDYIYEKMQKGR
ncbi:acyl carrier protein [Weizmannia acidilactici]|uniref:acyl carrier protein n=1 Tax=Weizmannia acidilactici TaxID=2607726 RepID=UPI00124DCADE|nr:acyl carrier protein [Weizmannia acidilactici]GER68324.1 acyl carrier protein [Weizmannia acidilactici]GER74613.1 acyl carrier protein [Weizmannia acidilactici]